MNCRNHPNKSVNLNCPNYAILMQPMPSLYRSFIPPLFFRGNARLLFAVFLLCMLSCRQAAPVTPLKKDNSDTDSLRALGAYYRNSGNDSLDIIAKLLIQAGTAQGDDELVVDGKVLQANYEWMRVNYPAATAIILEALNIAQQAGLNEKLPDIYATLGNLHKENENYPMALEAAEKGFIQARKNRDTTAIIYLTLVRAMFTHSYGMLKKNDSLRDVSLGIHEEGLRLAEASPQYERNRIAYYDNISQYYKINKDYEKALHYGHKGAALAEKYGQRRSLTFAYNWLGESYFYMGEREKGIRYLRDALKIAGELKSPYREAEINCSLYECFQAAGDHRQALMHYSRNVAIRDSLQVLTNHRHIGQLHIEYESGKKDEQIASLGILSREKTKRTYLVLSGLAIFVVLSVILYILYRANHRRNRQLTESNRKINEQSQQLQTLMKELHHRVKNNLQIVSSLLELQSTHLKDDDARQAIRIGKQRIEAMSLIHRSLYREDQPNMVNMQEYVTDLTESIMQTFGIEKEAFDLQLDIDTLSLDVDVALPLGLIINEWVTNAFKHAYRHTAHPLLSISLKQGTGLHLEISDNGPGMTRENWEQPAGSFGIRLVKVLSKQLKGRCEMASGSGTTLILQIPAEPLKKTV